MKPAPNMESILLSDWPQLNPQFKNDAINEKWEEVVKLRDIVTRAIEPVRAGKKIGSSLETAVFVKIDCNDFMKAFKTIENELASVFITSQASILEGEEPKDVLNVHEEGPFKIFVTRALGEKCPRCWKYTKSASDEICADCKQAIS